jgi:hypothetical protein
MAQTIPLEAWIALLDKFLAEAEISVTVGNAENRETVRTKLLGFIKSTPPQYEFLDEIARDGLKNLNDASLEIATTNIRMAANNLEKQRIIVSIATTEAQKGASAIKLEQLAANIETATKALENLKDMNAILNDDDTGFTEKIKEIQEKLKQLA